MSDEKVPTPQELKEKQRRLHDSLFANIQEMVHDKLLRLFSVPSQSSMEWKKRQMEYIDRSKWVYNYVHDTEKNEAVRQLEALGYTNLDHGVRGQIIIRV